MTKTFMPLLAAILMGSMAHADFSGSQDHLRNSGRSNTSNGTQYETSPNDLSNSQNELRRNGRSRKPVYMSCEEAEFGTGFWWECRQLNGN